MKKVFIQSDGKALGPSTVEEVRSLVTAGWLSPSDLAQYEGEEQWQPLSSMPEFKEGAAQPAPTPVAAPAALAEKTAPAESGRKSPATARVVARWTLIPALMGLIGYGGYHGLKVVQEKNSAAKASLSSPAAPPASANPSNTTANLAPAGTPAAKAAPERSLPVTHAAETRLVKLAPAAPAASPAPWELASPAGKTASTSAPMNLPKVISAESPRRVVQAPRRALEAKVDPQAAPFGDYDVAIIKAVRKRWFDLVDQHKNTPNHTGQVILAFKLYPNGSISDIRVDESSGDGVQEYLCRQAILDSQPFARWPARSTARAGGGSRELKFTFKY